MKKCFLLFLLCLSCVIGIPFNGYSQHYTLKSEYFSIVHKDKIYNIVHYIEFNENSIILYNKSTHSVMEFEVFNAQEVYDTETGTDLTILDVKNIKNNNIIRIIYGTTKNDESFIIIDDMIFFDLKLIDI